ncbi:hypothetical protein [Neorickettsia sennetsu]|nr:hypothetical protein [Neorickettsia sennetsu]
MLGRTLKQKCAVGLYVVPWLAIFATHLLLRLHFRVSSLKIMLCLILPIVMMLPAMVKQLSRCGEGYLEDKGNGGETEFVRVKQRADFMVGLSYKVAVFSVIACILLAYFTDNAIDKGDNMLVAAEVLCAAICFASLCVLFFWLSVQNICTWRSVTPDVGLSPHDVQKCTGSRQSQQVA